jgi:hypothetical protein
MPEEIRPRYYPDSDEEEEEESPPKRISSSQALRALSRSPLADDGTQWTTVRAPPDGSASVATNGFQGSDDEDEQLEIGKAKSTITKALNVAHPSPPREEAAPAITKEEEQADTPSDDEMLDMPPLRRQSASPASILSPANPPDISGNKSPTASTRSPGRPVHSLETTGSTPPIRDSHYFAPDEDEFEHDDLFQFDDGDDIDPQQSSPDGKEEEEQESSSESPTEVSPVSPLKEPTKLSEYSSSPARDIIRPKSEATPAPKGVVGSYKGRPFSIPIVSPEIHAMAASLGDVHSFVGSVHGRTGVDESDEQSFRASLRTSGTPRSLSERMRMEDIMEAEEQKRRES